MKLKVTVTQQDIDLGCKWSGQNCAIARAVQNLFEKTFHVCQVGIFRLEDALIGNIYPETALFTLPNHIQHWIYAFDFGGPVQPVTFEIERTNYMPANVDALEMAARAPELVTKS